MMTIDVASIQAAIRKRPYDVLSRMALADAYEEQGRTEDAAKQRDVCGWIERFSEVGAIKRHSWKQGNYWFTPDTMRFFNTRLCSTVCIGSNGIFFVSSDVGPDEVRRYTVRKYNPSTGMVATHSTLGRYKTRTMALGAAWEAAGE